MGLKLKLLDLNLSIAKVDNFDVTGEKFKKSKFVSITKTEDEVSLVIETKYIDDNWSTSTGWKAMMAVGPLDFSLVGIIKEISEILAEAGVSVFTISTFDTDYILVKDSQLSLALEKLKAKFQIDLLT